VEAGAPGLHSMVLHTFAEQRSITNRIDAA